MGLARPFTLGTEGLLLAVLGRSSQYSGLPTRKSHEQSRQTANDPKRTYSELALNVKTCFS